METLEFVAVAVKIVPEQKQTHNLPSTCPICKGSLEKSGESQEALGFQGHHQIRTCPLGHFIVFDPRIEGNLFVAAATEKLPSPAIVKEMITIISTPPTPEPNEPVDMRSNRTSKPLPRRPKCQKREDSNATS